MQWPGQHLTNHHVGRLGHAWKPLGWAGVRRGDGGKQEGPGGLVLARTSLSYFQGFCYNQG